MAGQIKVTGFRIGETYVEVDAPEGTTLPQICDQLDIEFGEGGAFWVNGTRVTAGAEETTRVRAGDEVEVAPKGEGG